MWSSGIDESGGNGGVYMINEQSMAGEVGIKSHLLPVFHQIILIRCCGIKPVKTGGILSSILQRYSSFGTQRGSRCPVVYIYLGVWVWQCWS